MSNLEILNKKDREQYFQSLHGASEDFRTLYKSRTINPPPGIRRDVDSLEF